MRIKAKRQGGSRLRRQLRRIDKDQRGAIRSVMSWAGQTLEDEIETRVNKLTGDTSKAAHHVVASDGLGVKIGYGNQRGFKRKWKKGFKILWLEFGTREMPASPAVRPAYRAKLQEVLDHIDAAVKRTIANLSMRH